MRNRWAVFAATGLWILILCWAVRPAALQAQTGTAAQAGAASAEQDPIRTLVGRLDLEKYKATIKGLTQFGDRRQGTDRNRAANDWIEAQLKSYGCTDVGRIKYEYAPAGRAAGAGEAGRGTDAARGGGRGDAAAGAAGAGGRGGAGAAGAQPAGAQGRGRGGANPVKGNRGPTGVNNDPNKQPDPKLRELDSQPSVKSASL